MCCDRPSPEDPANFESAQHRQIQIEHDQIRQFARNALQRIVSTLDDLDGDIPVPLERMRDELGDVGFVFDNQDARGHVPSVSRSYRSGIAPASRGR